MIHMIEHNTKNKIFFCWNDGAPLHGDESKFCSNECFEQYERRHPDGLATGTAKTYVYLNLEMLGLAAGQGIRPHVLSGFFRTNQDLMGVGLFEADAFDQISDAEKRTYDAYYRDIPFRTLKTKEQREMELPVHDPEKLRSEGILAYLQERGIVMEKGIANAIGLMAEHEEINPVQLINTL